MDAAFGLGSPVFAQTTEQLSHIFSQAGHVPPVTARLREWQRFWTRVHGQEAPDESLFIHQTYLALLARLVARRFIAPRRPIATAEELQEIISGDYFSRQGLGNYGEGDFFSWVVLEDRWELGLEERVLETVLGLVDALAPYDFTQTSPGILDGLYRQTVPDAQLIPRWLAEYIVEEELRLANDNLPSEKPDQLLLDPACGTGAFLAAAVGAISRSMMKRGSDQLDVLFEVPTMIRGMDRDPLAVAMARLNYLLALGSLVQEPHPPILVPVYLADASQIPASHSIGSADSTVYLSTPVGEFPLPAPIIENPVMLDWILGRLTNYMGGAQLRLHMQPEEEAVQEVMNAYYNYLTAPKARTPVPDPLTPADADILLETARSLVKLHIQGDGTLWLHAVQNYAAPAIFSRRGFDLLAGCGTAALLETCSDLYLAPQGRAAMVMTSEHASAASAGRRLVSLEAVLPDTCLLVSGSEQRANLKLTGGPIPDDSSWADGKPFLQIIEGP